MTETNLIILYTGIMFGLNMVYLFVNFRIVTNIIHRIERRQVSDTQPDSTFKK